MYYSVCSNYSEYSKHPDIDENVAVIVCGRQTKFLRYFSNQYEDIKRCLGRYFFVVYWLSFYNFIQQHKFELQHFWSKSIYKVKSAWFLKNKIIFVCKKYYNNFDNIYIWTYRWRWLWGTISSHGSIHFINGRSNGWRK